VDDVGKRTVDRSIAAGFRGHDQAFSELICRSGCPLARIGIKIRATGSVSRPSVESFAAGVGELLGCWVGSRGTHRDCDG
jgi:hypothetical protein